MLFSKKNKIIHKIILLVLSFSILNIFFVQNISTYAEGPGELSPSLKKIAVVGDSYTGHFIEDEGVDRFEPFLFTVGTINHQKNVETFNKAIDSNSEYILFATGVNDQALSVSPDVFETTLREHVKKIEKKHKYLFVHTYMDYKTRQYGFKYVPNDYDKVLRNIAADSENVFYINMAGIDKNLYDRGDGLHYNKFFNDTLKSKVLYVVDIINYNIYGFENDWMKVAKDNQIAVVGDKSAHLFYTYEKDKSFDLLEFSNDANLRDNLPLINEAMSSTAKYVLLSIGLKDYEEQSNPMEFGESLRLIANKSCETNKIVFFHTYMNYNSTNVLKNSIGYYDRILKEVASEYNNICYLDMHEYEGNKVLIDDNKDYNNVFYDILYNIMNTFISGQSN